LSTASTLETRRRDRKHRNQRIAAGLVGIGVFVAAVWIVTSGGPFERAPAPAVTGPTGPADPPIAGAPGVDYVIDLNTGVMTPLPDTVIRSLGGPLFEHQHAISPDGSLLAFVGTNEEKDQIRSSSPESTAPRSAR
jgi:hypothetical protein